MIRGQEWGRAEGGTKKEAEQEAAQRALEAFQRRGRGRRRRRGGPDDEGLAGAREVGEHVDEAAPYGSGLPAPEFDGPAPELDGPAPELDGSWPAPSRGRAPEPDVDPEEFAVPTPEAVVPLARPADERAAPRMPARAPAPPRASAPVPAPQAPSRVAPGFADGLDVPTAAPLMPSRAPEHVVGSVAARKKAPATWAPPPPEDGFGSGL